MGTNDYRPWRVEEIDEDSALVREARSRARIAAPRPAGSAPARVTLPMELFDSYADFGDWRVLWALMDERPTVREELVRGLLRSEGLLRIRGREDQREAREWGARWERLAATALDEAEQLDLAVGPRLAMLLEWWHGGLVRVLHDRDVEWAGGEVPETFPVVGAALRPRLEGRRERLRAWARLSRLSVEAVLDAPYDLRGVIIRLLPAAATGDGVRLVLQRWDVEGDASAILAGRPDLSDEGGAELRSWALRQLVTSVPEGGRGEGETGVLAEVATVLVALGGRRRSAGERAEWRRQIRWLVETERWEGVAAVAGDADLVADARVRALVGEVPRALPALLGAVPVGQVGGVLALLARHEDDVGEGAIVGAIEAMAAERAGAIPRSAWAPLLAAGSRRVREMVARRIGAGGVEKAQGTRAAQTTEKRSRR